MHPDILKAANSEFGTDAYFQFEDVVREIQDSTAEHPRIRSADDSLAEILVALDSGNFELAIKIGEEALKSLEGTGSRSDLGNIRILLALVSLMQGDHEGFVNRVSEDLVKSELGIPLWKRLGDIGLWLSEDFNRPHEDRNCPRQLIEEVYLASLDAFTNAEARRDFLTRSRHKLKRMATWLLPNWIDYLPAEYDLVRINMLLADNAFRMLHYFSAFRYSEEAKRLADHFLVKNQAEYAYFLSQYGDQLHIAGLSARDWPMARKGRFACLEAKRIADRNSLLSIGSYRYCSILNRFLMITFDLEVISRIAPPSNMVREGLKKILDKLLVIDQRTKDLHAVVRRNLELVEQWNPQTGHSISELLRLRAM